MKRSLVITLFTATVATTILSGCGSTGKTSRTTPVPTSPTAVVSTPYTPTPIGRCKDGTYSYSRVRSGACSGHGGVAVWWGTER